MKPGSKVITPYPPAKGKTGRRYGEIVAIIRAIPAGQPFTSQEIEHLRDRAHAGPILRHLYRKGELTLLAPGTPGKVDPQRAVYSR